MREEEISKQKIISEEERQFQKLFADSLGLNEVEQLPRTLRVNPLDTSDLQRWLGNE